MSDLSGELELLRNLEYRSGAFYWTITSGKAIRGRRAGTRKNGYQRIMYKRRPYYEHRLVYLLHYGFCPEFIDHINGDKSDNRVENLRPCSNMQNQYNTGLRADNTSGHKGVSFHSGIGKWVAGIRDNRKHRHLGSFPTKEEAAAAYRAAADEMHGEFSKLDTPEGEQ